MALIGVRDGERLVAGPLMALVDFVGIGRAPVMRRREFEFGGLAFWHEAMIATGGEGSKGTYYRIFTCCSQVLRIGVLCKVCRTSPSAPPRNSPSATLFELLATAAGTGMVAPDFGGRSGVSIFAWSVPLYRFAVSRPTQSVVSCGNDLLANSGNDGNNLKSVLASAGRNVLNPAMPHEKNNRSNRGETRRHFIKKAGAAAAAVAGASVLRLPVSAATNPGSIAIVLDSSDEQVKPGPVRWAADQLRDALTARGINAQFFASLEPAPPSQECVLAATRGSNPAREVLGAKGIVLPDKPESLALVRGK